MKRDAYKFQDKWDAWKQKNFKGIEGIREEDSKILIEFLGDMELGLNTPVGRKGKRGAGTLMNLADHNIFFLKNLNKPLLQLTKKDLHYFENDISEGKILKRNNEKFTAFGNYIKDFKAFWHWIQRTGIVKEDITADLSSKTDKPSWVYLTEEQAKKFFNELIPYYRIICWFMYDSGARVTEANSIQIKHFSKDFKQVTIPEEAAKTFERTINLKLCSDLIRDYVHNENLKGDDFLFSKDLWATNKYLKYNCAKLFGKEKISHPKAKGNYENFTLYDIRHNSACFWLNRYPTQSALMYRMGWKSADKVEYYTNFLGQGDKLSDGDMVSGEDKPKIYHLEKEVGELKSDNQKILEDNEKMMEQMKDMLKLADQLTREYNLMKEDYMRLKSRQPTFEVIKVG